MEYFKNKRYITPGLMDKVPRHLILLMWQLIDGISVEKDYYQFFNLTVIGEGLMRIQVIEHHQDEPEYHSPVIYIPHGPYCTEQVIAADDSEGSVMCLSEER